jgi:heptosyltransferase-2
VGKVLLARFHSLGDVVLATGIAGQLIEEGHEVEVATRERFRPIFEGLPISQIWTPETLRDAGRFDRVVDLQANTTSRRLLRELGPVHRNRGRSLERRLIVLLGRRPGRPKVPHAVERYAEAAELEVRNRRALGPTLSVGSLDLEQARLLSASWEATEQECVGLAEGGSRKMKRWPAERFDRLARSLARKGVTTLRFLEPIDGATEGAGYVRAPLKPLKALLSRCSALVTNDSGVMHMAVGLGIPVIALFGSTSTDFGFGPLGEGDQIVERDIACRPCAVHGARFCWQGHARCLREIEPDEILERCLEAIQRKETE